MYELPSESRQRNPQDSANFISKIFFFFQTPTVITAFKRFLTEEDLFDTRPCDRAELVQGRLERCWRWMNKKRAKRKGNLFLAVIWANSRQLAILTTWGLIEEVLKLGQAIALGQLLRYYTGGISRGAAYGLSFLLAMCCFLPGVVHHNFFYQLQAIGMRTRVACCSMVYQKLLQISSADYAKMSTGKAVNLLSNDVMRFDYLFVYLPYLVIAPFRIIIVTAFCWYIIGWYCIPGIALLLVLGIVFLFTPKAYRYLRKKTALLTDQRLVHMNELLNAIKVVKASCWEDMFMKVVAKVRRKEIRCVLYTRLLEGVPPSLSICSVKLTTFIIIITYLLVKKSMPSSEQVYEVLTAVSPTRVTVLHLLPFALRFLAESWISARRIEEILTLDDKFILEGDSSVSSDVASDRPLHRKIVEPVKIDAATMSWEKNPDGPPTLNNINLSIKQGQLVGIVGPVGSGKSSLLHGILGELFQSQGNIKIDGVVSYSPQDPWLFNGTIRLNVLFGSSYNQERLKQVYKVTCLNKDLMSIPGGDQYFLGDKGVGLSGGQRARVSLARAIYRQADIYLLDEPLGAVDVKTSERIFTSCITGFLKGKTVLLATHQMRFLAYCDWIVVINKGQIVAQGDYKTLRSEVDFSSYTEDDETPEKPDELFPKSDRFRTMTMERTFSDYSQSVDVYETTASKPGETMARGNVGWSVYTEYVRAGTGSWVLAFIILIIFCGTVVLFVLTDWWLSSWLAASDSRNGTANTDEWDEDKLYLNGFIGFTVASLVASVFRCIIFVSCVTNSSRVLHNRMFHKILKAPLYFFSTNPIGIILNRFSKDVGAMDDIIPLTMQEAAEYSLTVVGLLVYIAVANPYTLLVIAPYIAAALFLRTVYLKGSQDVKRLEAVSRTPVYAHLNNTLLGLSTIRAFSMENRLIAEFCEHLDRNTRAFNMFIATQRWFQLRGEVLSSIFVLLSAFVFVGLGSNISSSTTGLSLSYAVTMLGMFQWALRQSTETASYMTSVERVVGYSKLDEEPEPKSPMNVPPGWPTAATLQLKDVDFQYGPDTEKVLHAISFNVKQGEKVGLVGRTGAGKSSILNAILRLGTTCGTVLLDNVDTKLINLRQLRSHISLIPQEPVVFTATVRDNLDPFGNHSDEEIWDALRKVKMEEEIQKGPLALQTMVSEGGSSLSVGQRQLLCMARALLQNCSLILVDEATANVDRETDALIQKMMRDNFAKCTVLTVAHRLDTIIESDAVLVFHKGQLVERGSPVSLLQDQSSRLHSLAVEQGRDEYSRLLSLAKAATEKRHVKTE